MAGFKFDEVDQFVQESDNKINFLKLQDDGWYADVRFMYGPGEIFEGQTVHNVSDDPKKPRYVPCLRGLNDPLEACPLCANGSKINAQFFLPVFVISITSNLRGVESTQQVNQVMLFQKGSSFKGALQAVVRNTQGKGNAIVNSVFRIVRNGKAGDPKTTYFTEYVTTDNVGLEQLPQRPEILGSYILPKVDYTTMMEKYINKTDVAPQQTTPSMVTPRTLNANTFAGNTVVNNIPNIPNPGVQPMNNFQPINTNQAPVQAPTIGQTGGAPF
jgi:hypothetical protein